MCQDGSGIFTKMLTESDGERNTERAHGQEMGEAARRQTEGMMFYFYGTWY